MTDPLGNPKDYHRDAYGNLATVEEHTGASTYTTSYTYTFLKNLTKITDALGNIRNFTYDLLGRRLTAEDLHASGDATYGTWTSVFDAAGNLATSTDPKSQTVEYLYDGINRVLSEDYTGASGVETIYSYDTCAYGVGRLCGATTTESGVNYTYNALGLTATERKTLSGTAYTTAYSYDRAGNQTLIIYPDGSQVAYNHNEAGGLESVSQKESGAAAFTDLVLNFNYSPLGQIAFQKFGNGVETSNTYDADALYRLTNKNTTKP